MRRWTEGYVHIRMRRVLADEGFALIAGEFPGGSDHELYPLNVTDPAIARDFSPDPRRHSAGELIPDIVALCGRSLVLGEAKVDYSEGDRQKLEELISVRREHLLLSLTKFAKERRCGQLLPVQTLTFFPTLIFTNSKPTPPLPAGFSYIVLGHEGEARLLGPLAEVAAK